MDVARDQARHEAGDALARSTARFALGDSSQVFDLLSGPVAELVDAPDLKSVVPKGTCPFESDRGHHAFHALYPGPAFWFVRLRGFAAVGGRGWGDHA